MDLKHLAQKIIEAGRGVNGTVTFKARDKVISECDRMALVMLDSLRTEYPGATNGEVQEALLSALWWHLEIASSNASATPTGDERP